MLKKEFDVVVCGAGPAGMTGALFLSRAGKKVLLLEKEKFPRDKVCADNKTWKCLDIVRELGLWKEFAKLPKKEIRGVFVESPAGNGMLTPLHKNDVKVKGLWYNVRREVFDNFLADACKRQKNILFLENCEVKRPLLEGMQVVGVEFVNSQNETEQAFAKVIVGADGSASAVAQGVGLSPKVKGRYALNCRTYFSGVADLSDACELFYLKGVCPGYFWIFPVDNGLANVGLGMRLEDIEKNKIDLEKKLIEITQSKKFAQRFQNATQITPIKKWGVSVLGKKRKWSGNGFVLVGDAGTFAMTFSGEGVGPGMRSGKIAAQAIVSAFEKNDFSAKSLGEFDHAIWKVLLPETAGFRWLEFLLLHEVVFDFVIKKTSQKKELIELSSRMQNDYTLSRKLASPMTLIKMLF